MIPERYQLQELKTTGYPKRTEQNLIESDGKVIFAIQAKLTGGSKLTADLPKKRGKPLLHVPADHADAGKQLKAFLAGHQIKTLNVAGPRESTEPSIGEFVKRVLDSAFGGRG